MALFGQEGQEDKLPDTGGEWPPWDYHDEYDKFREWAAWYSGDPIRLSNVFSGRLKTKLAEGEDRMWAKDIEDEVKTMLHVPTGADISAISSDLLFGKPPNFEIPEKDGRTTSEVAKTQDRLQEIISKAEVYSKLVKAAETASALGGCYLKADWDTGFKDFPMMTVNQSDNALPVFYNDFLRKVLFHKVIDIEGPARQDDEEAKEDGTGRWLRHLEYHEPGLIQHGLYQGGPRRLGKRIPLSEHPKTENLEEQIINPAGIEDDILVRYIPNIRPNRLWRNSALGQSDYQGVEGLMDALDATYTSWIRDLKLAKSRILVPRHMLENEDGELVFNADKEVFIPLEASPIEDDKITLSQFEIRAQQHYDTARELLLRIVDSAGYAPQTFGLNEKGGTESGEALKIRERKSVNTKAKKERYFDTPIRDILYLMQRIDVNKFEGQNYTPYRPTVEFSSVYEPNLGDKAETTDILNRAKSASIEVRVRYLHPDWSDEQVEEEVEKIKDQSGMNVQAPELRA